MGNGMADFAAIRKVDSKKDWDLYCYYVAGLVGIGLCRMFAASGLEGAGLLYYMRELLTLIALFTTDPSIANVEHLANSMGLFLQKVNIIRDYLEDLVDGRTFWPAEIWSRYGQQLSDFSRPESTDQALQCLNHLILDTLSLIPDCIQFMSMLRNRSVFRFCAIPQVMAIATLALCFNNPNVFKQNVKIRKGLALKLILNSESIQQVTETFLYFTRDIASRIPATDPHALDLGVVIGKVDAWCQQAER
jgi:farnesyl-diphosphate farnesyltransferase